MSRKETSKQLDTIQAVAAATNTPWSRRRAARWLKRHNHSVSRVFSPERSIEECMLDDEMRKLGLLDKRYCESMARFWHYRFPARKVERAIALWIGAQEEDMSREYVCGQECRCGIVQYTDGSVCTIDGRTLAVGKVYASVQELLTKNPAWRSHFPTLSAKKKRSVKC